MTISHRFSAVSFRFFVSAGLAAMALLIMGAPSSARAETLSRQLEVGSRGTDVSSLQTFLAQDSTIYPQGLVTGYFGFLTKSAVANFQARNGIPNVGRVGPMTLPVINFQMINGMFAGTGGGGMSTGADVSGPSLSAVLVSADNNDARISWNTNEAAQGVVFYGTSPLLFSEQPKSVTNLNGSVARTDTSLRTSQNVDLSGLQSNTTYYYAVYSTDQAGNVSISWPSTFRTD